MRSPDEYEAAFYPDNTNPDTTIKQPRHHHQSWKPRNEPPMNRGTLNMSSCASNPTLRPLSNLSRELPHIGIQPCSRHLDDYTFT
jgi:hypothetical protein